MLQVLFSGGNRKDDRVKGSLEQAYSQSGGAKDAWSTRALRQKLLVNCYRNSSIFFTCNKSQPWHLLLEAPLLFAFSCPELCLKLPCDISDIERSLKEGPQ